MNINSKKILTVFLIIIMVTCTIKLTYLCDNHKVDASSYYKVKFNTNGGKFTKKKDFKKKTLIRKIKKGNKVGKLPKAKKTGYKLKGWYTKKSNGKKISKNKKIKKNRTYYARWVPNTYSVRYDFGGPIIADDGTETMSEYIKPIKYGSKFGTLPVLDRKNKIFIGWFTKPVGGKQIFSSTIFKFTDDIVIYAQYQNIDNEV